MTRRERGETAADFANRIVDGDGHSQTELAMTIEAVVKRNDALLRALVPLIEEIREAAAHDAQWCAVADAYDDLGGAA